MARIRRSVHPTDFSPASGPALRKALELAKDNAATLLILHVLPALPVVGDAYIAPTAYDEMLNAQRAQAERSMERLVKRARAAGVRATGTVLDSGAVADQIARFAKRQRADLIVMGTHGHGILARALLGSVAERVINRAPCPVMTVKGR
ncbi:MAG: universal stress protein [Candidatus Rokubacteria bacterium]|nr:universal stress protein [Candidatus Rokubacteria bacterium]